MLFIKLLFVIYLFIVYSLNMRARKIDIMNYLEQAVVDGGFKLHVDRNGQIIATDLTGDDKGVKAKPFAVRVDGGDNAKDPICDLYVNEDELITQD